MVSSTNALLLYYTITTLVACTIIVCTRRNCGLDSLLLLHLIFNVGMNMPAVPVSNATQYIPAPGSPVDEACKSPINFTLQCTLFHILMY